MLCGAVVPQTPLVLRVALASFLSREKIRDCSYSILGDKGAVAWVGKNGGEVFKNGCERPWDATLNKPVP